MFPLWIELFLALTLTSADAVRQSMGLWRPRWLSLTSWPQILNQQLLEVGGVTWCLGSLSFFLPWTPLDKVVCQFINGLTTGKHFCSSLCSSPAPERSFYLMCRVLCEISGTVLTSCWVFASLSSFIICHHSDKAKDTIQPSLPNWDHALAFAASCQKWSCHLNR